MSALYRDDQNKYSAEQFNALFSSLHKIYLQKENRDWISDEFLGQLSELFGCSLILAGKALSSPEGLTSISACAGNPDDLSEETCRKILHHAELRLEDSAGHLFILDSINANQWIHASEENRGERLCSLLIFPVCEIKIETYFLVFLKDHPKRFSDSEISMVHNLKNQIELQIMLKNVFQENQELKQFQNRHLIHSGVLHDINNLLTILMSDLNAAKNLAKENLKISEALSTLENSFSRAIHFSRSIISSNHELRPMSAELPELIHESMLFVFRASSIKKNIFIEKSLNPVKAEDTQILQIFQNLFINAKQAMGRHGSIKVQAVNYDVNEKKEDLPSPGSYVMVTVKDTGCGISPENIKQIFNPYFTTKKDGNGIGLASSMSMMKSFGGFMKVTSELQKGTEFYLYFPAAKNKKIRRKVLLIEEDDLVVSITSKLLEREGYSITCLKSEEEFNHFINQKRKDSYDFAVVDLTISGKDSGVIYLKKIKQKYPAIKSILTTAYTDNIYFINYGEYGFDAILEKPFLSMDLIEKMKELFHDP